jgi:hypothetical protein
VKAVGGQHRNGTPEYRTKIERGDLPAEHIAAKLAKITIIHGTDQIRKQASQTVCHGIRISRAGEPNPRRAVPD